MEPTILQRLDRKLGEFVYDGRPPKVMIIRSDEFQELAEFFQERFKADPERYGPPSTDPEWSKLGYQNLMYRGIPHILA